MENLKEHDIYLEEEIMSSLGNLFKKTWIANDTKYKMKPKWKIANSSIHLLIEVKLESIE